MRKNSFSRSIFFILYVAASALNAENRPNIIFFLSDDQNAGFMGCAGHPILKTPTMDRLAKQGVRFENMFVTTSICAASRASILTGLYERTHRYTFRTPPLQAKFSANSYPAVLKRAGYRTGFVGKLGVGIPEPQRKEMFDSLVTLGRGPYFKKQADGSLRHLSEITGDKAIEFLKTCKAEQPFCLSVSFNAPHAEDRDKENHYPWPKAVDGLYDDVSIPAPRLSEPAVFESQPGFLKNSLNRQRWFWRWDTPEKYQKNVRAYYRMISGIDNVMARVLREAESLGFAKDTVVIFSGDNGYYKGQRGFAGKWSHYEESLRVPLIIHDPRSAPDRRDRVDSHMALNLDIPATILAYAGAEIPQTYQGRSLRGVVDGYKPDEWRKDFFCEHLMDYSGIPKYEGIRSERYVYARYFQQQPLFEFLHDLKSDPDQLKNLTNNPEYAEALAVMRKRCDAIRDSVGGEFRPHPARVRKTRQKRPQSSATLKTVDGPSGRALLFSRASLRAGTLPALKTADSLTWSFWVKLNTRSPRAGVIVGNRGNKEGDLKFMKFTSHSVLFYNTGKNVLRMKKELPKGRWIHVALVKDGTALRYYLDGMPAASAMLEFDMPELPLFVGGDPQVGEFIEGAVDELRVYKRGLNKAEVSRLLKKESITDGLFFHHALDDVK
ncbi:MAG: sulfatase-like hydrolase/transferase [Planctomycetota bacterium]|nr:sulfatase-like hydrolase/transferase [Planctomycetota bacterium]MDP6503779.1 sulfatase-like hydrolase/transferase [Planctomycetota bacterium]